MPEEGEKKEEKVPPQSQFRFAILGGPTFTTKTGNPLALVMGSCQALCTLLLFRYRRTTRSEKKIAFV